MNRLLLLVVFLAGLAAVGWVGAGYVGNHALALATIVLIAVVYLASGLELRRFDQATQALARVVDATGEPPATLAAWLAQVPAPLQGAVRLRVEGERAALPGPALSPYLAGLLVLLGMLGTVLGMVVTLRGTGLALQGASDLAGVRAQQDLARMDGRRTAHAGLRATMNKRGKASSRRPSARGG